MEVSPFEVGSEELDYEKLIKRFGTQPISSIKRSLIPNYKIFNLGIAFSHRDFDKFMQAIKQGKRTAIVSGFQPSSPMHFGHLMTFQANLFFQRSYGVEVFIPISDDETYVTKKTETQEEALENAKKVSAQIIALGFRKKLTRMFIDSQYTKIYNFALKLSRSYTLSLIKDAYGFTDSTNPGLMFYPCVQAAHLLMPQLEEFNGPKQTLVLIGIDQDVYVRIARDIAEKFNFIRPGALHLKFLPGLKGGKMSGSKPETCIFLDDDIEVVEKKILNAFTGGQGNLADQRKYGGNPNICVVFAYLKTFFLNEKEIEEHEKRCKSGSLMCGECKQLLTHKVKKFLINFQEKVKKAEKKVDKFLLR